MVRLGYIRLLYKVNEMLRFFFFLGGGGSERKTFIYRNLRVTNVRLSPCGNTQV